MAAAWSKELSGIPETLFILPLSDTVLFPGAVLPMEVAERGTVAALEAANVQHDRVVAAVSLKHAETKNPHLSDFHSVGCVAQVGQSIKTSDGRMYLVLRGIVRVKIDAVTGCESFLTANGKPEA